MEQIFQKLSEIEAAAQGVLDEAEHIKQELSLDAEKQRQDFDRQLEQETDARIAKIRADLEKEKDSRLHELRKETEEAIDNLKSYYETHHEQLSRDLFQKILDS